MRGHIERKKLRDESKSTSASVESSEVLRAPALPIRESALPEPLLPEPADVERDELDERDEVERDDDRGHRFVDIPVSSVDHGPGHQSDPGAAPVSAAQPELTVSQPGDPLELEAEAVAEAVVGAEGARPASTKHPVGRTSMARSSSASGDPIVDGPTAARIEAVVAGSGQPLDDATRSYMEPRFGHSFTDVRVHTDASAAESAAGVQARAYTLGRDIVFGAGEFLPTTPHGQRLIAHELTHVVQQASGAAGSERSLGRLVIQRDPAAPTSAPTTNVTPPGMTNASTPPNAASSQSVRITVSTGPDPEYSSNSLNSGQGTVVVSANPEETYASFRQLGVANMWNMACVVGNLSRWVQTVPDAPPSLASPGGSRDVQITAMNAGNADSDESFRAAFPHFKKHVQTFYKRFRDFQQDFRKRGTEATLGLVAESRARTKKTLDDLGIVGEVTTERGPIGSEPNTTYKSSGGKTEGLSKAANDLYVKQEAMEKLLEKEKDIRGTINWIVSSQETIEREAKDVAEKISEARKAWDEEKRKAHAAYPILTRFTTLEQLKMLSNPASAAHNVGTKLHEILENIQELEDKLKASDDRILTLPDHLNRLADAFNLNAFERQTVTYMREKYTGDIETGQRVGTLIAIVLAAIAAAPTGGGSLVFAAAAAGEAAINTALLLQAYDQYSLEKAATGSHEDKAQALSQDEPSFFWLAYQVVTTLSGVAGNAKVVATELKGAYTSIRAGYKTAAATGQTGQLEAALTSAKIPKEASEGIVARAVKEGLAFLEGLAKGGPEGLQVALDLFRTSPSFYGIRLAVWRIKAGAGVAQATSNLQAARQQVINKILEDQKAKYPKATFVSIDQGFERPLIIRIGSNDAAVPSSGGAPSAPPSSAPPSSGAPSSAPPSSAPPVPDPGKTAKNNDPLPPEALRTPAKPLPDGVLVQTKKSADPVGDAATAKGGPSSAPPAGESAPPSASPMGGSVPPPIAPLAGSVPSPQAGAFHPPMAVPDGVNQALNAGDELRGAPQAAFGGASAAAGADVSVQFETTVAPFGPMSPTMQVHYGLNPGIPKPEYSGIYLNVSTRFEVHQEMTAKFAGKGSSAKVILRDKSTGGPDGQMYMFKAATGESVGAGMAHEVRPGTFFIAGRASYDVSMDLPTVGRDIVPLGVVVYNGHIGSLQPLMKNTENLADLANGKAINPLITPAKAEELYTAVKADSRFRTFQENLRAYDHIINNPDRNYGNFLVEFNDDFSVKRFYAIDQDLALKPGARSVLWKEREAVPRGAAANQLPNPNQQINYPNAQQSHLGKISKSMYDEMLMLKVNEQSVREALAATYGLDKSTLDGIFFRLDEVLADYNLRLKTMSESEVFGN